MTGIILWAAPFACITLGVMIADFEKRGLSAISLRSVFVGVILPPFMLGLAIGWSVWS